MKRIKIIIIALCAILGLNISNVMANSSTIQIQGNDVASLQEEQTVVIKLLAEEEVGVVSGKIECSSEIKNMEVKGKSNWTALYNPETKQFTAYKAEGAKEEDFMEIVFNVGETEGKNKITLKDIKMTTIKYETIEMENEITKEIEVKDKNDANDDKKDDDKKDDNEKNENKTGNTVNDGNNQNVVNKDKNTNTDTKKQNTVMIKNDNTIKKGILPQTGMSRTIVITAIVILMAGVIIGFYFCRKNKDIK